MKEYLLRDPRTGKWWTGHPWNSKWTDWHASLHEGAGFTQEHVALTVAALVATRDGHPVEVCAPILHTGPRTWEINPLVCIEP